MTDTDDAQNGNNRIGTQLGDYRLLTLLGEGAAGHVYLATATKTRGSLHAGEPVALKVYKRAILDQYGQEERIKKEFEVGGSHDNENLVRALDLDLDSDPPYLVLEYVDGLPLDQWIDMFHPVSGRLRLHLAKQLALGLIELHERGIEHRDLKPKNIMVSSSFNLKVMDLGVVRVPRETSNSLTPENTFLGTIRNASPEYLAGDEYDHRTDIYSLGTVLYALLTGEEVYTWEENWAKLVALVLDKQSVQIEPDNNRDTLSESLAEFTRKMLVKDVNVRLQSVHEALEHLEQLDATDSFEPLHGYVATALTDLGPQVREAIAFASSKIAEVAKEKEIYVYQPRRATDPLMHPDVEPSVVYARDRARVVEADILFVFANERSFGVGQELEIAATFCKPTVLIAREGVTISRMVRGSFVNLVGDVIYSTPEDLERKTRAVLKESLDSIKSYRRNMGNFAVIKVGQRIRELREQRGFATTRAFAKSSSLPLAALEALERGVFTNLSLEVLAFIAATLDTTITDLLTTSGIGTTGTVAKDANIESLERTARRLGWSATTLLDMRQAYVDEAVAHGRPQHLNQVDWLKRHEEYERAKITRGESPGADPDEKLF